MIERIMPRVIHLTPILQDTDPDSREIRSQAYIITVSDLVKSDLSLVQNIPLDQLCHSMLRSMRALNLLTSQSFSLDSSAAISQSIANLLNGNDVANDDYL